MTRGIEVVACTVLLLSPAAWAQSVAEPAARLAVQEQKVNALLRQFLSANEAIEARIDEVVETLTALRDSPESGTKVADTKIEAVQSLKASVEKYRTKRLGVEEQLRRTASSWDPETLKSVQAFLDEKIEARVNRIMELVGSVEGAAAAGGTKGTVLREDGWGNLREVEDTSSKEYKQGQKIEKRAEQVQEETREALETHMADMENRIRTLKTQSASTADPARKAELERQAAGYEERLAAARDTLSAIGEAPYGADVRTVDSSSEGHTLSLKLQEVTMHLQAEQRKVDMLGAQLMNELARLDSIRAGGRS